MSCVLQRVVRHTCGGSVRRHVVHVANVAGGSVSGRQVETDAFELMRPQLSGLMEDIHAEMETQMKTRSEISQLAK